MWRVWGTHEGVRAHHRRGTDGRVARRGLGGQVADQTCVGREEGVEGFRAYVRVDRHDSYFCLGEQIVGDGRIGVLRHIAGE